MVFLLEQIAALLLMGVFYATYLIKHFKQRQQGINTLVLGEGNKPDDEKRLELMLKITSFSIPAAQLASVWLDLNEVPRYAQWIGIIIEAAGVVSFVLSVLTMNDNWRAGIPEKKETHLVTSGIYTLSRNPAFLGFDLLYIGVLIAFPNMWHAVFVVVTVFIFDKQIRNEEKFLEASFGEEYAQYKKKVGRYL